METGKKVKDCTTRAILCGMPQPKAGLGRTVHCDTQLFPDEMRTGIAALASTRRCQAEQLFILDPRYIPFRGLEGRGFLPVIRISEMILVTEHTARHISGPLIALAEKIVHLPGAMK